MKKYLLTLLVAATTIILVGCTTNNQKEKSTEKQLKTGIQNVIEYKSNGKAVKDKSVLGDNVLIFSPKDDASDIQKKLDEIYNIQERNQFGDERYAIAFMPGDYGKSLQVNVGYYTQVLGLGVLPTDTNINKLWVDASWMNHNATCNFWRGAENFSINEYCMWANSQAVSLRRINSEDGIVLSDGEGWSSGGFMADSKFNGNVSSGSQQQYLCRNDEWNYWEGGVWNMVFTGVRTSIIPQGPWPYVPYTRVEKTPEIQEKPYLCYDDEEGFGVMVPKMRKDCDGISWENGVEGTCYSLNTFYIASPDKDNADTINKALAQGKNILFTPGVYKIDKTINVTKENTIIYGMGLATLEAVDGNICMETKDASGIKICGLLFDAGEKKSETMLKVGSEKSDVFHEDDPICLSDVYFRVGGGKYAGKTDNCITINSNNVLGDNLWVWRADHSDNVGWNVNTAPNGIIINGDDVTMYGLFVEHFQKYQTIWNGNNGRLYFYQSEMPYDVSKQKAYMSHNGTVKGYASLKISDDAENFEGYGIGIYCYNRDADIEILSGAEVPDKEGVSLHNVVTVKLTGKGQITHVINNQGDSVTEGGNTAHIKLYENGEIEK